MQRRLHPLIEDILRALVPPVIVFLIEAAKLELIPEGLDWEPFVHLMGGLSIAWSAAILAARWQKRRIIPKDVPAWFLAYSFLGTATLIGVLWELFEFVMPDRNGWWMQLSLADTMGDLTLDIAGAFIFIVFWSFFRKKRLD